MNISSITWIDNFNDEKEKSHYFKNFQKNFFSFENLKKEISKYKNIFTASIIHIDNLKYHYATNKILRHNNILTAQYFFSGQPFKKKNCWNISSFIFRSFGCNKKNKRYIKVNEA